MCRFSFVGVSAKRSYPYCQRGQLAVFALKGISTFPAESPGPALCGGADSALRGLQFLLYFPPMPVKQTFPYNDGLYFITFTCYGWLPLIQLTDGYDLVYKCSIT
ncbi:MAG: hypothetical protein M3342_14710 [Bacteroidota bacterium]|nr:hypothetical protein [Bacteroidota bacterium]